MPEISTNTVFIIEKEGLTVSSFGIVRQTFEIVEMAGDNYSCQLISDNSIPKINPKYRENFSEKQVRQALERNKKAGWIFK